MSEILSCQTNLASERSGIGCVRPVFKVATTESLPEQLTRPCQNEMHWARALKNTFFERAAVDLPIESR